MLFNEEMKNRKSTIEKDSTIIECPNCSYSLKVNVKDSVAICPCCSSPINVKQPKGNVNKAIEKVQNIKTISAAKAYLEFNFQKYDWESFSKNSSQFSIPEFDVLLENMKTNEGDNKETWKLCFDYNLRCLQIKLNNIDKNIEEIVDKYVNGADESGCNNSFDILKEGITILKNRKEKMIDDLSLYREYAGRFGLDPDICEGMDEQIEKVSKQIDNISIVPALKDHPKIAEKIRKKIEKLEEKYRSKGINAKELYDKALRDYEDKNFNDAIEEFATIPDYLDSSKYINSMNLIIPFSKNVYYMHNEIFFYKNGLCKNKDKLADYANPLTKSFNKYLGSYGDSFFYFDDTNKKQINYMLINNDNDKKKKKKANSIKCINLYGEIKLDSITRNDLNPQKVLFLIKYNPLNDLKEKTNFYKDKKLKLTQKVNKKINYNNWSDLVELNLKTKEVNVLIEGVNSIVDFVETTVYYISPLPVMKKNTITGYNGTGLFSYDISARDAVPVLQVTGNSKIRKINPDKSIVFTRDDHGEHNKTIYTKKSFNDSEEFVVVRNVYELFDVINNKIFYLVGNSEVKSLCSINLDGSDYVEVMKYMQEIAFIDESWFYITRGKDEYRTLYRLPINGGEPKVVAFGMHKEDLLDENRLIVQGYLYYTNFKDVLCRVRLNGTGYQELVKDVYMILMINNNKVFYICLDEILENNAIVSLYNMNMDGSNRQKLIYNLDSIQKINDKNFVYIRDEKLESKQDLYADITDNKLNKCISKMYKKFDKKKKYPNSVFDTISNFNIDSYTTDVLGYVYQYPDKKSLKLEMKEVLKK